MSIGLYDADMLTYSHTAPNLELMKLAAYYKQKQHITVMTKNFCPEKYSKYIYQKDYNDGYYPQNFRQFSNIKCGGLAFSNNIYKPLPYEIEKMIPDKTIYDNMYSIFGTNKDKERIFKICLNAQHLRLSLDGQNIWNDYYKQLTSTANACFFFHDINLNNIKDSTLIIKELIKDTTLKNRGLISTKFPIEVYCVEDLLKWLDFQWSQDFFTLNYYGTMNTEEFKEVVRRCIGTTKLHNIQYIVTYGYKDQQDFVENGLEKIYDQLIVACSNRLKILLKYEDNFFTDKRWEDIFLLWKCYNSTVLQIRYNNFEKYRQNNSLYRLVKGFHTERKINNFFTKQEARELFFFVMQNNYPLFCKFYEQGLTEKVEGYDEYYRNKK